MLKPGSPPVRIASVGTAVPPYSMGQDEAARRLKEEYGDRLSARSLALIRAVFGHPSIGKRHFAFDRPEELLRESLDERIARFTRWAVGLSEQAIRRALGEAGVSPQDVAGLIVNTCTGYICPGLSTYLIERMDFSPKLRVYDLVGSGCGGAIPNLELAAAVLRSRAEGVVVSVSVEICSATFQMDNDMSLILSNALFGDGAAAAVLWREPRGYDLVSSASTYATAHREAIRYVHRNGQLHNQLSPQLPELVGKAAADVVSNLLEPYALRPRDVPHWALHTGGEKIVNAIRDEVGLSEEQLKTTRDILREYGNMSSPTVLFVLRRIMDNGVSPGDWSVLLAFGAGLSAHGFLLRKESSAPCGSLTAVPGDAG